MGQPKTGKDNNINSATSSVGANVVTSDLKKREQKIMHKTTGEKPEPEVGPGFAKASPNFKDVKPDEKVVASEEAQRQAIEANIIQEGLDADDSGGGDNDNDQS